MTDLIPDPRAPRPATQHLIPGIDALLDRLEARTVSGTVERADGNGPLTAILPDGDCRAAAAVIRALRTAVELEQLRDVLAAALETTARGEDPHDEPGEWPIG